MRFEYYTPALPDLIRHDKPSIILIAYNTAPEAGLEAVKHFRNDRDYAHIPIIILIEELPRVYITDYYRAGANTVIKKPSTFELTRKKIKVFFDYWFGVAEL